MTPAGKKIADRKGKMEYPKFELVKGTIRKALAVNKGIG